MNFFFLYLSFSSLIIILTHIHVDVWLLLSDVFWTGTRWNTSTRLFYMRGKPENDYNVACGKNVKSNTLIILLYVYLFHYFNEWMFVFQSVVEYNVTFTDFRRCFSVCTYMHTLIIVITSFYFDISDFFFVLWLM